MKPVPEVLKPQKNRPRPKTSIETTASLKSLSGTRSSQGRVGVGIGVVVAVLVAVGVAIAAAVILALTMALFWLWRTGRIR